MKAFYDLHIHTCLSPCAEDDMTPVNVVNMAKLAGIDIIAVTDHNTVKNCGAAIKCGEEAGITVIPGMELTTAEEAHIICLFPELSLAEKFELELDKRRSKIPNRADIFGRQLIVDKDENIISEYPFMLSAATEIGTFEIVGLVEKFGGAAYPAHIDRQSMSVVATLGFITPDMNFKTVEFSREGIENGMPEKMKKLYLDLPYITASDAHRLEDIKDAKYCIEIEDISAENIVDFIRRGELKLIAN